VVKVRGLQGLGATGGFRARDGFRIGVAAWRQYATGRTGRLRLLEDLYGFVKWNGRGNIEAVEIFAANGAVNVVVERAQDFLSDWRQRTAANADPISFRGEFFEEGFAGAGGEVVDVEFRRGDLLVRVDGVNEKVAEEGAFGGG
jgi:hypothetical protein